MKVYNWFKRLLIRVVIKLPKWLQEPCVWYSLREYLYAREQLKQCISLANKELLKAGGYSLSLEWEAALAKRSLVRAEGLIKTGFSMWGSLPPTGPLVKRVGRFSAIMAGQARDHRLLCMLSDRLEAVKRGHSRVFERPKEKSEKK